MLNRMKEKFLSSINLQSTVYYFLIGLVLITVLSCSDRHEPPTKLDKPPVSDSIPNWTLSSPEWMKEAIIYEITPYNFVKNGTFKAITEKLPELKELGVNTIWLQPVTKSSSRGQGYDVVDYFEVNPDLGTEEELHELVDHAKKLKLRILFDVVLNHTSIYHPYAQNVIQNGDKSFYYSYYQMEMDDKPYSSFYNRNEEKFITYFWEDLVNLNYDNEDVQVWMIEMCKYWMQEYNIDGFRFDAIWGVIARNPGFIRRLIAELKNINPDFLLLAEDKGSDPNIFALGFDAAYDWTADMTWISQWAWEYEYDEYENLTMFNHPDSLKRKTLLQMALFENRDNAFRLLRFMENNDMPHFITDHTISQTKMVAGLLFSLPGIPMMYNGQEIAKRGHPYTIEYVFKRENSIKELDNEGFFEYYQKLIQLRKENSLLSGKSLNEISVPSEEGILAFLRWSSDQNFIIILNLFGKNDEVMLDLNDVFPTYFRFENSQFFDVLSNETFRVDDTDSSTINIPMKKYGVRWLKVIE